MNGKDKQGEDKKHSHSNTFQEEHEFNERMKEGRHSSKGGKL